MNHNYLTVVIISYNMGHLISKALDSLRIQTCTDFEVIIVDNHSEDNTKDVVGEYSDLDISFYEIHNEGILSKSRNMGMEYAKGNWIAFLDADDYWMPQKVEKLYECFRKLPENVVAVSHACREINKMDERRNMNLIISVTPDGLYKKLVMGDNPFCLTATTIKREAALAIGGFSEDVHLRTVEDFDMWIRLARIGNFYILSDILAAIVLHETNYSRRANIQANALEFLKREYIEDTVLNLSRIEKKSAYKNMYFRKSRMLQKNGFFGEAREVIKVGHCSTGFYWKMEIVNLLAILRINR